MWILTKLCYASSNVEIEGIYQCHKNALSDLLNVKNTNKNRYVYKIKEKNLIKVFEKGYLSETIRWIYQIIEVFECKDDKNYNLDKLCKDNDD